MVQGGERNARVYHYHILLVIPIDDGGDDHNGKPHSTTSSNDNPMPINRCRPPDSIRGPAWPRSDPDQGQDPLARSSFVVACLPASLPACLPACVLELPPLLLPLPKPSRKSGENAHSNEKIQSMISYLGE